MHFQRRLCQCVWVLFLALAPLSACIDLPNIPTDLQEPPSDVAPVDGVSEGNTEPDNVISGPDDSEDENLPRPSELVINELYYDAPAGDTDGELFVELFGSEESWIGAYQVRFVNGAGGTVTDMIDLPEEAMTGVDGFYVIADGRTGALDTTQVSVFDLIDNFDPQNGPDGVQLLNESGELLDSLVYGEGAVEVSEDGLALGEGEAAIDVSKGISLSRFPAGFDTDNNELDFLENTIPSPGSEVITLP